jgi:hypothetical protein
LFVCSFVRLECLFVCGGPVRDGRARAGTSPARSEGPLGVLWVLTHGARRASAGWLRAHSGTQSTRTVHACTPTRARAHVPHPPRHCWEARTLTQHHARICTPIPQAPTHAQAYSRGCTHAHAYARTHMRARVHACPCTHTHMRIQAHAPGVRVERPADVSGAFLIRNDPLVEKTGQCRARPGVPV